MRIAIPIAEGLLALHFGHAGEFILLDVKDGAVVAEDTVTPPPHAPGVLPAWLHGQGVDVIIAGGMGRRAMELFAQNGIQVVVGAEVADPKDLAKQYLAGELVSGRNVCDH